MSINIGRKNSDDAEFDKKNGLWVMMWIIMMMKTVMMMTKKKRKRMCYQSKNNNGDEFDNGNGSNDDGEFDKNLLSEQEQGSLDNKDNGNNELR